MYSNSSNRNSALTAINSALSAYSVQGVATSQPAGVNTSGTAGITISISCKDADVEPLRTALLTAWSSGTRASTGQYISEVKVS